MPQQEQAQYHTNRTHLDEAHAAEMDELMDEAIADAQERGEGRTIADEAADWLDEIDAILIEEEQFAVNYLQKGGE